jgi:hypothetical protein
MTVTYNPDELLEQISERLKAVAFDPIPELTGFDYPPAVPILDAGVVMPPPIDYRVAMGLGVFQLMFELHLYVGSSAGHEQQKTLWKYLNPAGSRSILALIEANRSLGIVGSDGEPRVDAHVAAARPLGLDEMLPLDSFAFGTAFTVPVIVTNKE